MHDNNVPNTVTNQWEELVFDYTADIGKTVTRLTIIPDFPSTRTAGSMNYFDRIQFVEPVIPTVTPIDFETVGNNRVIELISVCAKSVEGKNGEMGICRIGNACVI